MLIEQTSEVLLNVTLMQNSIAAGRYIDDYVDAQGAWEYVG